MTEYVPLERQIQKNILKYLNSLPNTRAVKWSQNGRQKGNPDILCCINGRLVLFEVKRPLLGKATLLQRETIKKWKEAGAISEIVESVDDVRDILSNYCLTGQ